MELWDSLNKQDRNKLIWQVQGRAVQNKAYNCAEYFGQNWR